MTPPALLSSNLLSFGAKLRAFFGAIGLAPKAPGKEETVEEFFARQLGPQVVERLVGPFTSGVYAGNIQQLSATAAFPKVADLADKYGSIVGGLIRAPKKAKPPLSDKIDPAPKRGQLGNFQKGLQTLPDAIAAQLGDDRVCLQWEAQSIAKEGDRYITTFTTPSGTQTIDSKAILLTAPAYRAAPILKGLDADLADELANIPYPHVAAVTLAYDAKVLPQPFEGFGQLFPRGQGIRTLGTIWTSSLFPGRAPAGYQCTLSYIGGATDPDLANLSDEEVAQAVHKDLSKTLLTSEAEPIVMGVRRWKQAIPQYTLGHKERIARIGDRLADFPGLVLCTNYLDGVSLGDCVRRAEARAADLVEWLNK